VHNVQLMTNDAAGRPISDDEVAAFYLRAFESAERLGVTAAFEVHVNMWSEHFGRVREVADRVARAGARFRMTLDASHVIFKLDNPAEQDVQGLRADTEARRVVLDPYSPASVTRQWIEGGLVAHA